MNKIIRFLAPLFLLSAVACEDFLDHRPKGSLNDGTLATPEGVELLCTSAYGALHSPDAGKWFDTFNNGGCNGWLYSDVRSDIAYKGGGGIADCADFHAMEIFIGVYPQHGHINGKWCNLYSAVQRANSALRVLNNLSENDYPQKNIRIGEMKFLRSYFFFELHRIFGRIPYFDEKVGIGEYTEISNVKYTRDQLLGHIAQDLQDAIDALPELQKEVGRVNKNAARALKAKVLLYRAYKHNDEYDVVEIDKQMLNEVVNLCDELEGSYSLMPDFQDLDKISSDNGVESVFEIQFSHNDGTDLHRTSWFFALCSPTAAQYAGCGFFLPSQSLVNSYRTDENGLPFFEESNDVNIITKDDGYKNNVDPRLDFVVGRQDIRWKTYTDAPYSTAWCRDAGTYGTFSSKRHLISPEDPDMWNLGMSDLNWKLIRYADVLLWKAEALVELERESEALPLVNQIRNRAKNSAWVKDWTNPSNYAASYKIGLYEDGVNCTWTQDYARKAVRFERKIELAMEGDRFFDLVRWGVAADVMNDYFDFERTVRPYMGEAVFTHGKDEYLPIPSSQIELSHNLYKQNPGYNN